MDPRPLRVGIIGYGLAGSVFHAPLVATTPGLTVSTIVTRDPERQTAARAAYPAAAILPDADALIAARDIDLIVVAAPNRAHVSLALAAAEARLPCVVDKPLAPSSAEGEKVRAAFAAAGTMLSVFQNRRWDGDFLTVALLIRSGQLGQVVRFESRYERFRPEVKAAAWRERATPEDAGGLLFDLGAHLIDQTLVLFGRPASVYAEIHRRRKGAAVDDDTFVALGYADGTRAHLAMNMLAANPAPRFRIIGLGGTYEKFGFDPQEDALRTGARPRDGRGQENASWGQERADAWGSLCAANGSGAYSGHRDHLDRSIAITRSEDGDRSEATSGN